MLHIFYAFYCNDIDAWKDGHDCPVLNNVPCGSDISIFVIILVGFMQDPFVDSSHFLVMFGQTATDEELLLILSVLNELAVCRTITGQQQLADLLVAQIDLTKPLLQADDITKAISVLNHAKNFFSVSESSFLDVLRSGDPRQLLS